MDIQQLLKGTDCSCGRHHSCDIGFVSIEKGAISHLTALTDGYRSVLLVADENTFRAAGADTAIRIMRQTCPDMIVGAGTVLTTAQVDEAIAAGDADLAAELTAKHIERAKMSMIERLKQNG